MSQENGTESERGSEENINIPLILQEELVCESSSNVRNASFCSMCIPYRCLPVWLQENDYLVSGYRPPLPTIYACCKSVFRWHTETINIWTHLLGFIGFMYLAVDFWLRKSEGLNFDDQLVMSAYFLGAVICLGLSFMCHTFYCYSSNICNMITKLDYCGIGLLIMGSFIPLLYYSFYCQYWAKLFYLSSMSIIGSYTLYVNLSEGYSGLEWRVYRAGLFVVFGSSGIFPVLHYEFIEGWYSEASHKNLVSLMYVGIYYGMGAVIFMTRVPERWFPGKCDIWFHSHQLFHLCVLGGALAHYQAMLDMARYRHYLNISGAARYKFWNPFLSINM